MEMQAGELVWGVNVGFEMPMGDICYLGEKIGVLELLREAET